jgi:predicted small metal-binding protein
MKVIDLECGPQIRADNDQELLVKLEQHVSESHPDLIGTLAPQDVLAMAYER